MRIPGGMPAMSRAAASPCDGSHGPSPKAIATTFGRALSSSGCWRTTPKLARKRGNISNTRPAQAIEYARIATRRWSCIFRLGGISIVTEGGERIMRNRRWFFTATGSAFLAAACGVVGQVGSTAGRGPLTTEPSGTAGADEEFEELLSEFY